MVLQNYQNLIEMTSNIIYIVAFGVGFKCPRKIHLNTQGEVDMTEAGRAERDRVDREQWLGRFPGGIPPYPTTTPEEEAHWAKCESVRQKLGHTILQ